MDLYWQILTFWKPSFGSLMWPPGYMQAAAPDSRAQMILMFTPKLPLTRSSLLVWTIRFKKNLSSLHHPLGCEGSGRAFSQQMIWVPSVYQTLFYILRETAFRQEVTPLALKKLAFKRILKHFLDAALWPQASLVAQTVKNLPSMREIWVWSLGWKDPLEAGMETTPVFLLGESHGQKSLASYSPWSRRVRYDRKTKHSTA